MHRRNYLILTLLFILGISTVITGCDEDPASGVNDPTMKATVNGNSWTAGANVDGTILSTLKTITGAAGDGTSITLSLSKVTTPGSLDIDGGNIQASYISGGTAYTATSGTINVTELDAQNNITGTFNFEGSNPAGDPVTVQNGTFSATLR